MPPKGNLLRNLQQLEQGSSAERRAAQLKRQSQSSGEILQTFLAYRLADAASKMALGIAIGDSLLLKHEPTNEYDPNAVNVFWKEQEIGFLPRDMAALIVAEVPEVASGLEGVVTGLSTTSLRDAFRLQISIPLPRASHRLRELGVSSTFAWDFDRTSGNDKLRLVVSCTETAFRELQELLRVSYDVSKCGYSYYPSQQGRHYPWYLSLTEEGGQAPEDRSEVERRIRSHFGVPSESTRVREREERLKQLEQKQEEVSRRLETSRAEQRRLEREVEQSRNALQRRAAKAEARGMEALELAESMESELLEKLSLSQQELELALAVNHTLEEQLEQASNELETLQLELDYLQSQGSSAPDPESSLPWRQAAGDDGEQEQAERLWNGLRSMARRQRLKPRDCLDLVSQELCPGSLLVLDSAWRSADAVSGFELGDQLFEQLWLLATAFREQKLKGAPDRLAGQVFAGRYAARESNTIEENPRARRERTFTYNGRTVVMWQHLKIGVKDSVNHTLRVHFHWDDDLQQVVIGHCGQHLHSPNHGKT
ncbi:HIRAN domain-containing protein [Synechococcus sp. BA-132 BA5]|uniref:HIRAN domain-containing protein n=1 Tax=Synechococcus sp. BA-132 BA5 TaxID=3110252 RepID=UPI002B21009E|nr:HIRAN domain-containing protein [Synechococcus sp. BA-132 BA5]MEA5413641.1 HIRAN domain-containing protein [Synechococcus sp. BA-132 BA5]